MRRMYEEFYLKSPNATYYLRGRGFTSEDFERVTSEVAGADMSDFFKRYVRGIEAPPYDEAFASVGLRLVREATNKPSAGILPDTEDPRNIKVRTVRSHSPAEDAGIKPGDIIVAVGNTNSTRENLLTALNRYRENEPMLVTIRRGGQTLKKLITLGAMNSYRYRLEELPNPTPETRALRAAWLNG
jgi:predicted metalloprotease with PDZ domain